MSERMKDLGRMAAAAVALNVGAMNPAEAGFKPEVEDNATEQLSATHIYEVADAKTKALFDDIDSGELRAVPAREQASVFLIHNEKSTITGKEITTGSTHFSEKTSEWMMAGYPNEILAVAAKQGLEINLQEGKIVNLAKESGDSIEWDFALLNKKGDIVSESDEILVHNEGDWLIVEIVEANKDSFKVTFAGGDVISADYIKAKKNKD